MLRPLRGHLDRFDRRRHSPRPYQFENLANRPQHADLARRVVAAQWKRPCALVFVGIPRFIV